VNIITVRKATKRDIRSLSRKLLKLLEDKNGPIYMENVAKFDIPEEYVRKAFSEETLLVAALSKGSTFYLVLQDHREIVGFAQITQQNVSIAELDRIVIFPEHTRKGIGTQLLTEAIKDQQKRGIKTIIVSAGREEKHARQFYEKNGFKAVEQATKATPWGNKLTLVTYELELTPN
jgi:N-acetylglutamate synthase-like GNAT family acetyltransferase